MERDLISRQAVIDFLTLNAGWKDEDGQTVENWVERKKIWSDLISGIPSAELTLYGYNIEHLEVIARILQKENISPERVVEALTDIGKIVEIVKNEFEEALRKSVEDCII